MFTFFIIQPAISQMLYLDQYRDNPQTLTPVLNLQSEEQCLLYLQQDQKSIVNREQFIQLSDCQLKLLNNNGFSAPLRPFNILIGKRQNYMKHFRKQAFEKVIQYLPENSPILNIIEPCYLWAQNMTHLFLKIKFSSKLDVPGAQQINRLLINITTPSIYIEGYSFELLTRYILRIQTYRFLNPNFYSYKIVELGQIVIEIMKSPSPYFWKNIHSNVMYNPPNQYIWWDMYYQYRSQLEVAFGLLEDTENQREENERNQLKEELKIRQGKLKKIKNENQELYKQLYCRNCIPIDGDEWSSWII